MEDKCVCCGEYVPEGFDPDKSINRKDVD